MKCFSPLLVLFLFVQWSLGATPLWNGVNSGMTVPQVMEKFQGSVVPVDPSKLATGATEKVRIQSFKYLGREFLVRFYFVENGLMQVSLHIKDPGKRGELVQIVDAISKELSLSFGSPKCQAADNGASLTLQRSWDSTNPRVSIVAVCFGPTDELYDGGFLNLNYQAAR